MKKLSNTKWVLMAAVAMALPGSAILSGCSGGSDSNGLNFNGGVQANQFAGTVATAGPVRNANNQQIGTLGFTVAADGTITGTLDGTLFQPRVQVQLSTKSVVRAVITGTGSVNPATGEFTITFDVNIDGQPRQVIFTGVLSRSGNVVTAANLTYRVINTAGTTVSTGSFALPTLTLTLTGGPDTPFGSFTVSGGNATGGSVGGTTGSALANRQDVKITALVMTFTSADLNGTRSVGLTVRDPNGIKWAITPSRSMRPRPDTWKPACQPDGQQSLGGCVWHGQDHRDQPDFGYGFGLRSYHGQDDPGQQQRNRHRYGFRFGHADHQLRRCICVN